MTFLFDHSSQVSISRLGRGIALERNKRALDGVDAQGNTKALIRNLAIPDELVVPLIDYNRRILHTHLQIGDQIRCGDDIADMLVAPASGVIRAIEPRAVANPDQTPIKSVVIRVDHERDLLDSTQARQLPLTHITRERLHAMGVAGLGGAGFPTVIKLDISRHRTINTLIINGAECEPVIACDEAMMQAAEHAQEIVRGVGLLIELTQCQRCVVVIEDDKSNAICIMQQAVKAYNAQCRTEKTSPDGAISGCPVTLLPIAPIYPSGAEQPLIELVTGTRLAPHQKPIDTGIVCVNVATAESVAKACDGYPLISRIITVAGNQAQHCVNVRARLGTSVQEILRQTDNLDASTSNRVRIGGPLSGFDLDDRLVPVTIKTNCITVDAPATVETILPCIRCGACEDVCPTHLAPQQLYWFGQTKRQDYLDLHQLDNCIECACCDLVCPSRIPLTDTFRQLRADRQKRRDEALRAAVAEDRYQAHIERENRRALSREKERIEAQAKISARVDDADDVLARIKRSRRAAPNKGVDNGTDNEGSAP